MKILLKRGSSKALDNYIGTAGEIAIDQDDNNLRVFDGKTSGGIKIVNYLKQSGSGYIVLENGFKIQNFRIAKGSGMRPNEDWDVQITLPIPMNNTTYSVSVESDHDIGTSLGDGAEITIYSKTTSSFMIHMFCRNSGTVVPKSFGLCIIVVGY